MSNERQDEPDESAVPFGLMPGINGNPVAPSFRDGPRREPDGHPWRTFLLGLAPVVILVAVLLVTGRI